MSQLQPSLSLDPTEFKKFIYTRKNQYNDLGSYPTCVVLGKDMDVMIHGEFFKGNLSELVTFNTDRSGNIRMFLAGIKVMFTDKLGPYDSMWVLDKYCHKLPDGTVSPTTSPGGRPTNPPAASAALAA